jgi:ATP-binding cassette subfamily B protein
VRDADQILVLDEGQIVERGRHDDLIGHNGLYAALHRKQLLEEELAAS